MTRWREGLRLDPLPALLRSRDPSVGYFAPRDLLDESGGSIDEIQHLAEPQRILRKQRSDGSWPGRGSRRSVYPADHGELVATFKQFRTLVEWYGFTCSSDPIAAAAEYLVTFQTDRGDFRGFIGNQYAPYYTGYMLALLIKAGFTAERRIDEGMQWLLAMRQDDGGWTVPVLTHRFDRETLYRLTATNVAPVEPDRTQPFSHNWTDMVLRAFAAHSEYRPLPEARFAAGLLKSRFFSPDVYSSRRAARYWTRFIHWWPNLLTAMETLAALGFENSDPDLRRGREWFIANQAADGLWDLAPGGAAPTGSERERVALRICRLLRGLSKD